MTSQDNGFVHIWSKWPSMTAWAIQHIAITNFLFKFAFSHLPKPLFSIWATFAVKDAHTKVTCYDNVTTIISVGKCA